MLRLWEEGPCLCWPQAGVPEKHARDEQQAIEAATYVLSLGGTDVNARLTDDRTVNGPGTGKIDGRTTLHFAATLSWGKYGQISCRAGCGSRCRRSLWHDSNNDCTW